MSRQLSWAWITSAVVVAAIAGVSCSATGDHTSSGLGSGGNGAGHGAGGGQGTFVGSTGSGGGLHGTGGDGVGGNTPGGCDPSCITAGGTCQNNTCVLHENPGAIDNGTQTQLQGGGNADAALRFLYPYDKTVFPRGLIAPTIQIDGTAPDAVYLHITFPGMDYEGFYGASSPGRVQMSAPSWKALTEQAQAGDQVKVEITKISGGQVSGPITESWKIAPASMRGTIYYETYGSPMAGAVAIMKIQPGATTPTIVKQGCGHVCHTASADGSTLVSATSLMASASWDLQNNAAAIKQKSNNTFTYGGLYPDGSFLVSATHYRTWTPFPAAAANSRLYDTKTGAQIATPSWDNAVNHGGTTAFAPDGKYIAFNHEDTDNGAGHTLAVMNFDKASMTFSNLTDIANNPMYTLAWPAFTPDSKWVVFHAGSSTAFETDGGAGQRRRSLHHRSRDAHRDAAERCRRLRRQRDAVPAGERSPALLRADGAARGGRRLLLDRLHQSSLLRQHPPVEGQRRSERQALGRGDGHEPDPGQGPELSGLLPRRSGGGGRQPPRLLGPRPVHAERRDVRIGRRVLRRLLPVARRRRTDLRLDRRRLLPRVREVHHRRRLLHRERPLHQRQVRPDRASLITMGAPPPSPRRDRLGVVVFGGSLLRLI